MTSLFHVLSIYMNIFILILLGIYLLMAMLYLKLGQGQYLSAADGRQHQRLGAAAVDGLQLQPQRLGAAAVDDQHDNQQSRHIDAAALEVT